MSESMWTRIVTRKYYIIFVLCPTLIWLWGSVIAMFHCCITRADMDKRCRAAFWAAGAAAPFHVFTVHMFTCLIYPKDMLVSRTKSVGTPCLTYGLIFLAPFAAPLGVLWMYFACEFDALEARIPMFLAGMIFLIVTGYIPLFFLVLSKSRSDKIKRVNRLKFQTSATSLSIISSELSSDKNYKIPRYEWWQHPMLYMYTEGGATVNYVHDLITKTWLYHGHAGRDALGMKHSGLVVQQVHWICNRRLINIYNTKRDNDLTNSEQSEGVLNLSDRIRKSILSLKTSSLLHVHATQAVEDVSDSEISSTQHTGETTEEFVTSKQRNTAVGPLPLRDDEVYLFHGTKKRHAQSIIEEGLDVRRSRDGLYGKGIYLTESSQKADQYSDSRSKRKRKSLTMFIVRTRLMRVREWKRRAPYYDNEHDDKFDTLVAGYGKRFREFVVKDSNNCLPEFLVIYKRRYDRDLM